MLALVIFSRAYVIVMCVWFVSVCSHRVMAGVRAGTVSAPNPPLPPARRKFRDGDTVLVTGGRLRGHVGVVVSFADRKYTVRLQDGSDCLLRVDYFKRTSLRCVCGLSLCVHTMWWQVCVRGQCRPRIPQKHEDVNARSAMATLC